MSVAQRLWGAAVGAPTAALVAVITSGVISSAKPCSLCTSDSETNRHGPSRVGRHASGEDGGRDGISVVGRRKRARSGPVNPCEEYNTFKWRLSYASRKDDCNAEPSCVFIGRNITGACAPRDPSLLQERDTQVPKNGPKNVPLVLPDQQAAQARRDALRRHNTVRNLREKITELETEFADEEDEGLAATRIAEVMDALDVEQSTQDLALTILKEEGFQAVQEFAKSQLASAAAEELRLQKSATEGFAKDFIFQVLRNPELPGQMGKMLESVFKDPSLSTGIRHLIYNAVGLDHTFQNTLWLTRRQVTWLLTETNWMDDEAAKLCAYLVRHPQTEISVIPLVAWAARDPAILQPPAARGLANSLSYGADRLEENMIWVATETLKSDWALELAKATAREMLVPPKSGGSAKESRSESGRNDIATGENQDDDGERGDSGDPLDSDNEVVNGESAERSAGDLVKGSGEEQGEFGIRADQEIVSEEGGDEEGGITR